MDANSMQVDAELISLGKLLQDAALAAKSQIDAIPADVSAADEHAMIEAASATANNVAEKIAALPAHSDRGLEVKARATAWLEGNYWDK